MCLQQFPSNSAKTNALGALNTAETDVFSADHQAGGVEVALRWLPIEFQIVRPTTAKAQWPYMLICIQWHCGTDSMGHGGGPEEGHMPPDF